MLKSALAEFSFANTFDESLIDLFATDREHFPTRDIHNGFENNNGDELKSLTLQDTRADSFQ